MPITGTGWELHITRIREEVSPNGKPRTVGQYEVFHDGAAQSLSGTCFETGGPGDNGKAGNNRCVEAGRYPLLTQDGGKYCTIGFTPNTNPAALRRPALELGDTGKRKEILIHPGRGFLSSVGCINPYKKVAKGASIDFIDSRTRTIALINDLTAFLGVKFPSKNGRPIPDAFVVIDGP